MEDNQPRLHIKERKEEERVFNGFFSASKDAFSFSSSISLYFLALLSTNCPIRFQKKPNYILFVLTDYAFYLLH